VCKLWQEWICLTVTFFGRCCSSREGLDSAVANVLAQAVSQLLVQLEAEASQGPGGAPILPVQGQEPSCLTCTNTHFINDRDYIRLPLLLLPVAASLAKVDQQQLQNCGVEQEGCLCLGNAAMQKRHGRCDLLTHSDLFHFVSIASTLGSPV